MARRKKEIWYVGSFIALLLAVATMSGTWTSVRASLPKTNEAALNDLTRLAMGDFAPKGASLDARIDAPRGMPLNGNKYLGSAPLVVKPGGFSRASLETLRQIDGSSANPLTFEKSADGRWTKLTFAALGSFKYDVPAPDEVKRLQTKSKTAKSQIPRKLKDLDGVQCLLAGFMVPLQITRDGKVSSFALTQDQQFCCFGIAPAMNEWVMVTMEAGYSADFINDEPVVAYGQLAVGEEIDDGQVISLYRMKATEVISAHELLKRTKKTSGVS